MTRKLLRLQISDLSLSHPKSVYFWGMIFMFLLVLWMRLFTHYFGQWLLLQLPQNTLPGTVMNLSLQARHETYVQRHLHVYTHPTPFSVVARWSPRLPSVFPDLSRSPSISFDLPQPPRSPYPRPCGR